MRLPGVLIYGLLAGFALWLTWRCLGVRQRAELDRTVRISAAVLLCSAVAVLLLRLIR
ncbi:protein MIGRI [Chitinilyticum litopenaei]|uniref:protein MIGRI n=1 Tax=Chitinilyticum litopenaei TaxID=1121276 RepID=UPI0003FA3A4D|nr:hypothetical protein [Chitinilyticum litopenaei]